MRGNRVLQASAAVVLGMLAAAMTMAQDVDWSKGMGWPPFPNLEILTLDPEAPTTIWAGGTQGYGLFRSLDDGRSWLAIEGNDAPTAIKEIAIDSANGGTVYAALDAVFRSDDGGQHWTIFPGPGRDEGWFSFAKVNALAVDPNGSGRLWAATSEGVSRSDDRGQTWSDAGGLAKEVYELLVDRHLGNIYASSFDREYLSDSSFYPGLTRDGGPIFVSTDGGEEWVMTADLPEPVLSFALDPFQAGTVYAGTLGAFLRSTNSGASWETLFTADPTGAPEGWYWFFSIVPDPVRRDRIYASTSYGVVRSTDGGRTWLPFSSGLPVGEARSLVISPDGRRLHVATYDGVFDLDLEARPSSFPCVPSGTRLCLVGSRYAVDLVAARRGQAPVTPGAAHPLGDRAGYFGLSSFTGQPDLPEIVVKMLADGTFGGSGAPVFYSSLTTLAYRLTVTDTTNGEETVYADDAQAPLCGGTSLLFKDEGAAIATRAAEAPEAVGDDTPLALLGGRFSVTLETRHPRSGAVASGVVMSSGDAYGVFSLPGITGDPQFPEVVVKMVDARSFAGRFWFFQTGLTGLDYTLTVTDAVTGAVRTYVGATPFCGAADTDAFTDSPQASSGTYLDDRPDEKKCSP